MPAKNHLSSEQKKKLQKALKKEENAEIRERILILLLLNDGKTQVNIAEFLGCGQKKVSYWCVHGDPDNLESLKDQRMKGNHRKATEEYIEILLETVDKDPKELGYEFGRWTAKRLATYLEQKTGIQLSSSQVTRILAQKKYVYLWAKYSLEEKWDKEKRKAFKEKLKEYLRITKESPERLQVWFWDESGFSLRVIRRAITVRMAMMIMSLSKCFLVLSALGSGISSKSLRRLVSISFVLLTRDLLRGECDFGLAVSTINPFPTAVSSI
jgi:transposase